MDEFKKYGKDVKRAEEKPLHEVMPEPKEPEYEIGIYKDREVKIISKAFEPRGTGKKQKHVNIIYIIDGSEHRKIDASEVKIKQ